MRCRSFIKIQLGDSIEIKPQILQPKLARCWFEFGGCVPNDICPSFVGLNLGQKMLIYPIRIICIIRNFVTVAVAVAVGSPSVQLRSKSYCFDRTQCMSHVCVCGMILQGLAQAA